MKGVPVDLDALRAGGKAALARTLTALETHAGEPALAALLDMAFAEPRGIALGLTGPPGVGKSTLTNALITRLRAHGRSVGVIAVDPSSRRSRGALLGDRTRIETDPEDPDVFVRSMAARDRLGGLAELSYPAVVLMRAVFDWVIVETVGVGQSETDVRDVADLVVFCAQPGSGDALQFMKAGVTEVPDLVLVTKGDLGAPARRAAADLKGAFSLNTEGDAPEVIIVSSQTGQGIDRAIGWIETRGAALLTSGALRDTRLGQASLWAESRVRDSFGREGISLVSAATEARERPFAGYASRRQRLLDALEQVRKTF